MAKSYRTAKGRIINMEELRQANEEKVAAGNAGLNARGDRLGPGGSVAERVAERARQAAGSQPRKTTSVKPPISQTITAEEAAIPLGEKLREAEEARKAQEKPQERFDEEGNIILDEPQPTKKVARKKAARKNDGGDDASETPEG